MTAGHLFIADCWLLFYWFGMSCDCSRCSCVGVGYDACVGLGPFLAMSSIAVGRSQLTWYDRVIHGFGQMFNFSWIPMATYLTTPLSALGTWVDHICRPGPHPNSYNFVFLVAFVFSCSQKYSLLFVSLKKYNTSYILHFFLFFTDVTLVMCLLFLYWWPQTSHKVIFCPN